MTWIPNHCGQIPVGSCKKAAGVFDYTKYPELQNPDYIPYSFDPRYGKAKYDNLCQEHALIETIKDRVLKDIIVTKYGTSIAMVSGHINLQDKEFQQHYIPALDKAITRGDDFYLGGANGADTMAAQYLISKGVKPSKITIFIYEKYSEAEEEARIVAQQMAVIIVSGFSSYTDRDATMTQKSDYDIAWVRPPELQKQLLGDKYNPKKISGTERNLIRRQKKNQALHQERRELAGKFQELMTETEKQRLQKIQILIRRWPENEELNKVDEAVRLAAEKIRKSKDEQDHSS